MMINVTAPNGVTYGKSDSISLRHGFSTRIGGVSRSAHTASLNLAFGRGDEDSTVRENLRLFSEAIGCRAEGFCAMPQIHSREILTVTRDMCGEGYDRAPRTSCDGFVSRERGTVLCVRIADCVPVLCADEENGVIGAFHAGWRGTFSDIVGEGICRMCELGAEREKIRALIGPAICGRCYEVGEDVHGAALSVMAAAADRFFTPLPNGKYLCELRGANAYLLERAGIDRCRIDISADCTFERPDLYYSHRFTGGKRGTMLAAIALDD